MHHYHNDLSQNINVMNIGRPGKRNNLCKTIRFCIRFKIGMDGVVCFVNRRFPRKDSRHFASIQNLKLRLMFHVITKKRSENSKSVALYMSKQEQIVVMSKSATINCTLATVFVALYKIPDFQYSLLQRSMTFRAYCAITSFCLITLDNNNNNNIQLHSVDNSLKQHQNPLSLSSPSSSSPREVEGASKGVALVDKNGLVSVNSLNAS